MLLELGLVLILAGVVLYFTVSPGLGGLLIVVGVILAIAAYVVGRRRVP